MWLITLVPSVLLLVEVGELFMVDEAALSSSSEPVALLVLGYTTASLSRLHATEAQATACVDAWCIISVVLNLLCSGELDASLLVP